VIITSQTAEISRNKLENRFEIAGNAADQIFKTMCFMNLSFSELLAEIWQRYPLLFVTLLHFASSKPCDHRYLSHF
jgi:hypothetical protein